MLKFEFENAGLEYPPLREFADLELGLIADFRMKIGDKIVYSEEGFTLFELRLAFDTWLHGSTPGAAGFEFESVESEESGLIWFRLQPGGGYRVGSIHQEDFAGEVFAFKELRSTVLEFVGKVDEWVFRNFSLVVADYLVSPRKQGWESD